MNKCLWLLLWTTLTAHVLAGEKDSPFWQDRATEFVISPELSGAILKRLAVNRDGIIYVLTDKGVARLFDSTLALDKSFRPLSGKRAVDMAIHRGQLFYLFDDQLLSNGSAGKFLQPLPRGVFQRVAIAEDGSALLAGHESLALLKSGRMARVDSPGGMPKGGLFAWKGEFFAVFDDGIYRLAGERLEKYHEASQITTLAFRDDELLVGTHNGYYGLDLKSGQKTFPLLTKLPATNITCFLALPDDLWVGTTRGAFHKTKEGRTDYYASKRWLPDDHVVDMHSSQNGGVFILTKTGLSKIELRMMTLAEKAAHYDRKIRRRHIRFGFCSELRLLKAGDITSAEMIDTDNDGTWSNYYLASQAFRFGATGVEEARHNAWETFEALERLESINGLDGFPSRTFERIGFKFSDPERWHPVKDGHWEWKAHTSSDEITAHTFGCAVLYETTARTEAEKKRIVTFYDKIISHIVRNNYYLIDVDGQPTLWGRWHPEYVNHYPPSIGDRRLNSAEIIAMLQFAHHLTGKALYREKAFELMNQHGYLDNIMSSMTKIAATPGYIHLGNDMGSEWNHSDDLLAFVTYWVLYRYAFNDELRAQYAAAIKDHWDIEKIERCPLWNFIYAATSAKEFDSAGAVWTLREFPLELIDWTIQNSHRQDLTRLPENFRQQQSVELLPPDERRIMRWNGNPFALDSGSGGHLELAGDEFLLPYWMGRYLKVIE